MRDEKRRERLVPDVDEFGSRPETWPIIEREPERIPDMPPDLAALPQCPACNEDEFPGFNCGMCDGTARVTDAMLADFLALEADREA